MSVFEIVNIVVVLAVCAWLSYTDTRYRRIGNPFTFGLVLLGIACQAVYLRLGVTTQASLLMLVFGGLAVAFVMYVIGIWSPGDSKLFWGVSVALPPTVFGAGEIAYPPFVIAVNTFVPYFLLMAVIILVRTSWHQKWRVLKAACSPLFLLRFVLSIATFIGIAAMLRKLLPFQPGFFSMIFCFIILFSVFNHFVSQERQLYVLAPLALLSLVLVGQAPGRYAVMIGTTALLFIVTLYFVAQLGDFVFVREVAINELTAGCVPASIVIRDGNGDYRVEEVALTSFLSFTSRARDGEIVVDVTPEGLSENKIAELRELVEGGKLSSFGDAIKIQESVPFAPIIFIGVVLTILSKGLFITPIVELIGR